MCRDDLQHIPIHSHFVFSASPHHTSALSLYVDEALIVEVAFIVVAKHLEKVSRLRSFFHSVIVQNFSDPIKQIDLNSKLILHYFRPFIPRVSTSAHRELGLMIPF